MYTDIYTLLITGRIPVSAYFLLISGFPRKSIQDDFAAAFPPSAALFIQRLILTSLVHRFQLYIEKIVTPARLLCQQQII